MEDAVSDPISKQRLMRFQARQREIQLEEHRKLVGSEVRVLVDGPSAHDEGVACGRTSGFKTVNFPAGASTVRGSWVDVRIGTAWANTLRGELLVPEPAPVS